MAYINRRDLLHATLCSITQQTTMSHEEYEVVIVDDGSESDQLLTSADFDQFGIQHTIITIPKDQKTTWCPSPSYNKAWKASKGQILLIQSPECMHVGDVLTHAFANIVPGLYYSYAAYPALPGATNTLLSLTTLDTPSILQAVGELQPYSSTGDDGPGWYNHPSYRPSFYHFCGAMHRQDMEDLNGFDERYAGGVAYDDDEFVLRIQRKGMRHEIPLTPMIIHLAHKKFIYYLPDFRQRWDHNANLFNNYTRIEPGYRANG